MKPLNLDNKPCNPVSSNCVVWQGPTLECINLCQGDTVSDVIAALATELCKILDQTNVTDYDLSCLGITSCGPTDFKGLIELLIEKICELQDTPAPSTGAGSGSCPDCVVTVASCFVEDGATTMQLLDYVQMIASKVCALIGEIGTLSTEVANLDIRVTALENQETPGFTLPSILVDCTLDDGVIVAGNAYTIDEVLNALVNDDVYGYCALLGSTGLPADLLSAVSTQCITGADSTLSHGGTSFAAEYLGTWINSPVTVADAINNLWIVVCDTWTYLDGLVIPETIVTAGDNVTVTPTVVGPTTTYEVAADNAVVTAGTGITVTPTTVGATTTYEVAATTELLVVTGTPASLPNVTPGLNSSRLCDGAIQLMPNIDYNTFPPGSYNATTGIFTIPEDGIYEISFFQHMTIDSGTGWFDALTPGQLTAGIVSATGCNFWCINNFTPVVTTKHASITGTSVRSFTAGQLLTLKVINTTAKNYTSVLGDGSRMSIKRLS
jgi:hypothetical protein